MLLLKDFFFVRLKGLEPPRLSAPDPKSGAATNYATAACCVCGCKDKRFFLSYQVYAVLFYNNNMSDNTPFAQYP